LTNDYVKKIDIEGEEQLKKSIDIIKKEDSVLGDKLTKFYEKSCELDRLSEDIIKYVLDADKVNGALDKAKSALRPIEHKLADSIKKFEVNYCTSVQDLIVFVNLNILRNLTNLSIIQYLNIYYIISDHRS